MNETLQKRVLIAEDNNHLRGMLANALREHYLVTEVSDGVELEGQLTQEQHDLVIADLNLPNCTASAAIRNSTKANAAGISEAAGTPPILIITGMDSEDTEVKAARRIVNVKEVLFKPLGIPGLVSKACKILSPENVELNSQTTQASNVANESSRNYILTVDDDPEIRDIMSLMLESEGYQVRACADLERAVQLCCSIRFDIILLDFMLESDTANQFLDDLKDKLNANDIPPVLMITGFGDSLDLDNYQDHPEVKAILSKPISKQDLVQAIEAHVSVK